MVIPLHKHPEAPRRLPHLLVAILLAIIAALPVAAQSDEGGVTVHGPLVLPSGSGYGSGYGYFFFYLDDLVENGTIEGLPPLPEGVDHYYEIYYPSSSDQNVVETKDGDSRIYPYSPGTATLTFTNKDDAADSFSIEVIVKLSPIDFLYKECYNENFEEKPTIYAEESTTFTFDDEVYPLSGFEIARYPESEAEFDISVDGNKLTITGGTPGSGTLVFTAKLFSISEGKHDYYYFTVNSHPSVTLPTGSLVYLRDIIGDGSYHDYSDYVAVADDAFVVSITNPHDAASGSPTSGPSLIPMSPGKTVVTFTNINNPENTFKYIVRVKNGVTDYIQRNLKTIYIGDPFILPLEGQDLMPLSEYKEPMKNPYSFLGMVDFDFTLTDSQLIVTAKDVGKGVLRLSPKGIDKSYDVIFSFAEKPDFSAVKQLKTAITIPSDAGKIRIQELIDDGVVEGVPEVHTDYTFTLLSESSEGVVSINYDPYYFSPKSPGTAKVKFEHNDFPEIAFELDVTVKVGAYDYIKKEIEKLGTLIVGKEYSVTIDDPDVLPLSDYQIELREYSKDIMEYSIDPASNTLSFKGLKAGSVGGRLDFKKSPYVNQSLSMTFIDPPSKVEVLQSEIEIPTNTKVYISALVDNGVIAGLPSSVSQYTKDYNFTYQDTYGDPITDTYLSISHPGTYTVHVAHKEFPDIVQFDLTVKVKEGLHSIIQNGMGEKYYLVYIGEPKTIEIPDAAMHKDDYQLISKRTSMADFDFEFDPSGKTITITGHQPGQARMEFMHKFGVSTLDFEVMGKRTIEKIVLNEDGIEGAEGDTKQLNVITEGVDAAEVTWSSSDNKVATVDGNGLVTLVKEGTATITATYTGLKAYCTVKVNAKTVISEIQLDKSAIEGYEGESGQLTVTTEGVDAAEVTWSSSDETVATVDGNGLVTFVKEGTATITATYGELTATCQVTVHAKPITAIELDKTSIEGYEGETEQLTVTTEGVDAAEVTWSSSDETVATVDGNGLVTFVKEGTATITATYGELTATCQATVKKKPITAIGLNKTSIEGIEGETGQLTVTTEGVDAAEVTWSSSDETIATVDGNGLVTFVKEGTATVTATYGELTATCQVTVKAKAEGVESIEIDSELLEGIVGETAQLKVTTEGVDGADIRWSSSDPAVASVDGNGLVTFVSVGTATITAAYGDITATCKVIVSPKPITAIELNKTSIEGYEGETGQLTVTTEGVDAAEVTWSSSDETIATVDGNGLVTFVKEGTATITATYGELTATCQVTVLARQLEPIELNKTSIEGYVNDLHTLAVVTENAGDVTWSSSDEEVAKVDTNGNVSLVGVGEAVITATTADGRQAQCAVKVHSRPISGIDDVNADAEGFEPVYDLNGRIVAHTAEEKARLAAGVYIQGGKKIYLRR